MKNEVIDFEIKIQYAKINDNAKATELNDMANRIVRVVELLGNSMSVFFVPESIVKVKHIENRAKIGYVFRIELFNWESFRGYGYELVWRLYSAFTIIFNECYRSAEKINIVETTNAVFSIYDSFLMRSPNEEEIEAIKQIIKSFKQYLLPRSGRFFIKLDSRKNIISDAVLEPVEQMTSNFNFDPVNAGFGFAEDDEEEQIELIKTKKTKMLYGLYINRLSLNTGVCSQICNGQYLINMNLPDEINKSLQSASREIVGYAFDAEIDLEKDKTGAFNIIKIHRKR